MKGLLNKKIAIAADRQSEAISVLVSKQGGSPLIYPIQGKWQLNKVICKENVLALIKGAFDWVVLTTGIGAKSLEEASIELDMRNEFFAALSKTKIAVRGSKTLNWLKESGLIPELISDDGTMESLIYLLAKQSYPQGKTLFMQLFDQDDLLLESSLANAGFNVYLSKPYWYEEPKQGILNELIEKIKSEKVDAVVFTSKTQVKNLFQKQEHALSLTSAFNGRVVAAAIGKITAYEVEKNGVKTCLQPQNAKMGEMIVRLSEHYNTLCTE
ncbi:uroporphyrinogen-III synthase [Heyndrickxia acidicola]|uniref:Uroporphyrinogen-III synthase n=1 Tax=Heyndrickxia acidicola TaxID=209389 RepID=A0ABU6MLY6_9BACI|nr:uroporphyrinogen-III synthase [Heyndrickxia acidicola]MED1205417.1 uroporphyrinogen-III synthase [Heyndrickxia acidicola]